MALDFASAKDDQVHVAADAAAYDINCNKVEQRTPRQYQAEVWHQRCLEAERDRAIAAASEGRAQLELAEALEREKALAIKAVELRMERPTSSEKDKIKRLEASVLSMRRCLVGEEELHKRNEALALKIERLQEIVNCRDSELSSLRRSFQRQEEQLISKSAEVEAAREQMRSQTAELEATQAELRSKTAALLARQERDDKIKGLEIRVQSLQATLEKSQSKESEALRNVDSLYSRCVALEDLLRRVEAKSAVETGAFRAESERLAEINMMLRLDLQESVSQGIHAGSVPFYHQPTQLTTAEVQKHLAGAMPSIVAPSKARQDYPRSAANRKLRKEAFSARTPNRTHATGRYDEQGRLLCFDAEGRAV
eukprot:TRINITY_DN112764_c0_g1_i1.p1 TRINITY_DN112764_c0_g1~~TRINITY_DN112764_c0_g1_i1.p1  ORF type:complete len:379 (+),score=89.52 TRINITY_DN112764_c0_g1_i1:35-1138(+)